jgi:hypothetical protein
VVNWTFVPTFLHSSSQSIGKMYAILLCLAKSYCKKLKLNIALNLGLKFSDDWIIIKQNSRRKYYRHIKSIELKLGEWKSIRSNSNSVRNWTSSTYLPTGFFWSHYLTFVNSISRNGIRGIT